ncbi:GDP-mannose 4,6-dehydratase [soil metagenome]
MATPAPSRAPIVVTGVAGFVGSQVAEALLRRGDSVVGIDNFDPFYSREIKEGNLRAVQAVAAGRDVVASNIAGVASAGVPRGTFTFFKADLCEAAPLKRILAGGGGVIHLAGKAGVRPSLDDPAAYARANVLATATVLHEAHEAGAGRIVVASSSSVYGDSTAAPFREEADVSEPISPYAATKRACELLGYTHHHLTKMPTALLRFFTVYGPRQRPDLAINLFMRKALRGEEIVLHGALNTARDYTYISDIVSGVLAAYDRIPNFGYRVWNLGNASPVTLGGMVEAIGIVAGKHLNIRQMPGRPGDVQKTAASLERSRAELDYAPKVKFLDGLRMQWEWMKRNDAEMGAGVRQGI